MFLPKSGPPRLLQSHDQYPHTSGVLKWSPKPTIMPLMGLYHGMEDPGS